MPNNKRDRVLIIIALLILAGSFWYAANHPNRALAGCHFEWFGEPGGYWDCSHKAAAPS